MKRRFVQATTVMAVIVLLASIVGYRASSSTAEYKEVTVERGDITASVFSTGTVQPENRVDVKSPINGRAEDVLIKEGDRVHKGQVLLSMSSSERAALLDAATARGPEELKRWQDFYRTTPLMAPVSGQVIQRNIEPGQSYSNADVLFVIADRLIVEAPVDETDIAQIRVGQKTSLILDAYPKEVIPSHVGAVAYEARTINNVTTYMVTVVLEKTPEFVRTGMTANVNFDIDKKSNVLVLPAEALKTRKNKTYVLVPDGKNQTERIVQTGLSDGRRVEITEGLAEGEKVLIRIPVKGKGGARSFSPVGS